MGRNEFSCDCNIIHQDAVDKVLKKIPDENTFNRLADLFKLIGDTTRCKILFAKIFLIDLHSWRNLNF